MTATITSTCPVCGRTFEQPDDPGRKKVFDSAACRQRNYRQHGGRASGTRYESPRANQRKAEQESWAREEARREQERQRSQRRRATRGEERIVTPDWCKPRPGEASSTAAKRRICHLLMSRANHDKTPEHEATECRTKAEALRERYGL